MIRHAMLFIGVLLITSLMRSALAQELTANQQQTLLAEAQAAYDEGVALKRDQPDESQQAFELSAARFQQLVDRGRATGPLYYNLGNALLQAGSLGRAIHAYRSAASAMPGDGRLRTNLDYARTLRTDQIQPTAGRAALHTLLFWHHGTSTATRVMCSCLAWIAFWCVLLLDRFRSGVHWRWIAIMLAIGWLIGGASAAVELLSDQPSEGVLIAPQTIVRKGGGEGFEPQFAEPLHEGVEFTIAEERTEWWRIILPDGSEGWIPQSSALRIALTH